jgi:hypothetical protein
MGTMVNKGAIVQLNPFYGKQWEGEWKESLIRKGEMGQIPASNHPHSSTHPTQHTSPLLLLNISPLYNVYL